MHLLGGFIRSEATAGTASISDHQGCTGDCGKEMMFRSCSDIIAQCCRTAMASLALAYNVGSVQIDGILKQSVADA